MFRTPFRSKGLPPPVKTPKKQRPGPRPGLMSAAQYYALPARPPKKEKAVPAPCPHSDEAKDCYHPDNA